MKNLSRKKKKVHLNFKARLFFQAYCGILSNGNVNSLPTIKVNKILPRKLNKLTEFLFQFRHNNSANWSCNELLSKFLSTFYTIFINVETDNSIALLKSAKVTFTLLSEKEHVSLRSCAAYLSAECVKNTFFNLCNV